MTTFPSVKQDHLSQAEAEEAWHFACQIHTEVEKLIDLLVEGMSPQVEEVTRKHLTFLSWMKTPTD